MTPGGGRSIAPRYRPSSSRGKLSRSWKIHVHRFCDAESSAGWPTQARFWLEWGCSHITDLVQPTNKIVLMPWGLTRFHHSGQSHFVTFCCYHRRRSFTTDASRRIFESALERVRRSFRLSVYGYVVMAGWPTLCATQLRLPLDKSEGVVKDK